jgi:hypothetical protein
MRNIPKIDVGLCKALEGKNWQINSLQYQFGVPDKTNGLVIPPYPAGIEAYAYRITEKTTGRL